MVLFELIGERELAYVNMCEYYYGCNASAITDVTAKAVGGAG